MFSKTIIRGGRADQLRERGRERERMHCWLIREIGWSASEEKERQCLMAREKGDGEKEGICNFKKKKKRGKRGIFMF